MQLPGAQALQWAPFGRSERWPSCREPSSRRPPAYFSTYVCTSQAPPLLLAARRRRRRGAPHFELGARRRRAAANAQPERHSAAAQEADHARAEPASGLEGGQHILVRRNMSERTLWPARSEEPRRASSTCSNRCSPASVGWFGGSADHMLMKQTGAATTDRPASAAPKPKAPPL